MDCQPAKADSATTNKRGRPKGSCNPTKHTDLAKRSRGRPRAAENQESDSESQQDSSEDASDDDFLGAGNVISSTHRTQTRGSDRPSRAAATAANQNLQNRKEMDYNQNPTELYGRQVHRYVIF